MEIKDFKINTYNIWNYLTGIIKENLEKINLLFVKNPQVSLKNWIKIYKNRKNS